jgi:predicted MPP superfamily phosphohydrolase
MKYYIEQVNVESAKINDPIKISSFSDLHLKEKDYNLSYIKSVIQKIGELNPDYITGVGDYYFGHKKEKFEMRDLLIYLLHGLREIAPVILSLGNHDLSIEDEMELRKSFRDLKSQNIYPLDNESIEFNNIYFSGYFARRDAYAVSKMSKRKTEMITEDLKKVELSAINDKFSVLLSHNPFIVLSSIIMKEFPNIYDYDLILSGHCHNGLLSLKKEENLMKRIDIIINKLKKSEKHQQLISLLESLKSFGIMTGPSPFTRYARGLHDVNGTQLFISRGVTGQNKSGDSFISEINLIHELKK